MGSEHNVLADRIGALRAELPKDVTLVAVSKTKPASDIVAAMESGQLDFGENRVQELQEKAAALSPSIRWHQIGHLQTNKVKAIIPFVHLIHAVDSEKLLIEIERRAGNAGRIVDILLQVHIAQEEAKFGWEDGELRSFIEHGGLDGYSHVRVRGLMGMATLTEDTSQIRSEFNGLRQSFDRLVAAGQSWDTLSMGMSGDWRIAVEEGSTMVRVGSSIFGDR
jgi:pyridoxal phosphate enzyme (YggS family)